MPRKHRSSASLTHLIECQQKVDRLGLQTMVNSPVPLNGETGTYATNRHTRRRLKKLHGIEAKRMCDLGKGK
ncbi:hypothetical protein [Xenorhabdus taiwanensis]|uniref:Transposase n=1 Tax=Xenorhabdus taiwanensis TaxID=3085177 RepID=A0ABN7C4Y5_9GAMM|nr:hypothetical protein TCT1_23770 [Xenorhabdus sp. TCT-1]